MNRKLKLISTLLAVVLASAANMVMARNDKPNVVLMLSDNVGYGDIGAFQGGAIRGVPNPSSALPQSLDRPEPGILADENLCLTANL